MRTRHGPSSPSTSASRLGAVAVAFVLAGAAALSAPGCGTQAVAVEACRSIETARCMQAPACGIDLSQPVHSGAPASDVDACIRFYHDQCLHGLESGKDPGSVATNACVAAINTGNCDTVKHPENDPACAFLAEIADAAVADTASADAFSGCPAGCGDQGTQNCSTNAHQCVCFAPLGTGTTTTCIATSYDGGAGYAYCCD
jgi:hypothetical protein